jgi:hypothetical protein
MNTRFLQIISASLLSISLTAAAQTAKPVLLYSRAWNAEGETRYQPDGSYSMILAKLKDSFTVTTSKETPTPASLKDVAVVVVANPSEKPVGKGPEPRHIGPDDRKTLLSYLQSGGGLILMGNQENHNLETVETNLLLAEFGIHWESRYTDIKGISLPAETPIIGGLKWGYYSGNTLVLSDTHAAKPAAIVTNDIAQAPLNGPRNEKGILLATATPGKGHVVAVTDAGWIGNPVLEGKGIGGTVVPGDDNLAIFTKLALWAAGQPASK